MLAQTSLGLQQSWSLGQAFSLTFTPVLSIQVVQIRHLYLDKIYQDRFLKFMSELFLATSILTSACRQKLAVVSSSVAR